MDHNKNNATALLVEQFKKLDQLEVEIPGFGTCYASPMTFAEKLSLREVHEEKDARKQAIKMCKIIVNRTKDDDGNRVFLNHDKKPASIALADGCDGDTITDIFTQVVGVDPDEDADIEEVSGKSNEEDSD